MIKRGRGRPEGINRPRIDITLAENTLSMIKQMQKSNIGLLRKRSWVIEKAVRNMYDKFMDNGGKL